MKEIDIKGMIVNNFGHIFDSIIVDEYYESMYEVLHSDKLWKMLMKHRKYDSITQYFPVVDVSFIYRNVRTKVKFVLAFEMYWSDEIKCIKPSISVDDISIEEPEFSDKENNEWYWRRLPYGGKIHSIAGLSCEGHQYDISHKKLDERIINYFNYLIENFDYATDKNVGSPDQVYDVDFPAGVSPPSSYYGYNEQYEGEPYDDDELDCLGR